MLCDSCVKKNVCMDAFRIQELVRVLQFAKIKIEECSEYLATSPVRTVEAEKEEEEEEEEKEEEGE